MKGERGHEFVEHTADLGIRAWAPTLAGAFEEAARGLFEYMVDLSRAEARDDAAVDVRAESPERLLFTFLDELLFRHQTELLVFTEFAVDVARDGDEWTARGVARGEPFDEARHGHIHEIKAMTYHDLRVREGPPAEAFMLVDI